MMSTQKATDGRMALIFNLLQEGRAVLCILTHRAEFVDVEGTATLPNSLLRLNHTAIALCFQRNVDNKEERA